MFLKTRDTTVCPACAPQKYSPKFTAQSENPPAPLTKNKAVVFPCHREREKPRSELFLFGGAMDNEGTDNKVPVEYLTVEEAMEYLKVPKSVIYAKWRLFGGAKIGRHIRIPRQLIDEYFRNAAKVSQEEERIYQQRRSVVREHLDMERYSRPITIYHRRKKVTLVARTFEERIADGEVPVDRVPRKLLHLVPQKMKIQIAKGKVPDVPRYLVKRFREEVLGQQDDKKNEGIVNPKGSE